MSRPLTRCCAVHAGLGGRRRDNQRNRGGLLVEFLFVGQSVRAHHFAMIGGEHDDRVVAQTGLVERREHASGLGVGDFHEPVVNPQILAPLLVGPVGVPADGFLDRRRQRLGVAQVRSRRRQLRGVVGQQLAQRGALRVFADVVRVENRDDEQEWFGVRLTEKLDGGVGCVRVNGQAFAVFVLVNLVWVTTRERQHVEARHLAPLNAGNATCRCHLPA